MSEVSERVRLSRSPFFFLPYYLTVPLGGGFLGVQSRIYRCVTWKEEEKSNGPTSGSSFPAAGIAKYSYYLCSIRNGLRG